MELSLLTFDLGKEYDITALFELGEKADECGFNRFWLGEHYGQRMWNNPETLIPVLLGLTENITVGCAGILLRLHNPYRVAMNFKMMNALFPSRVDLGLASGLAANDKAISYLTNYTKEELTKTTFESKLDKLMYYLKAEEELATQGVFVPPYRYPTPDVWMLGSSYRSLPKVLDLGVNFSKSIFHEFSKLDGEKDKLEKFRADYKAKHNRPPQITLAFAGVMGTTDEKAKQLYNESSYKNNTFVKPNIIGNNNKFFDTISHYQEHFGIDEFVFLDLSDDLKNRMYTMEVLSEAFDLVPVEQNFT